jgi:hypothetical protein
LFIYNDPGLKESMMSSVRVALASFKLLRAYIHTNYVRRPEFNSKAVRIKAFCAGFKKLGLGTIWDV